MHTVLRTEELVRIICECLHPHPGLGRESWSWDSENALPAFVRVCQSISDVALDVLWRVIDIEVLYALFPADMVITDKEGRNSFSRPPWTLQHWSRFNYYARRVRDLRIRTDIVVHQTSILAVLALSHRQLYPFPNLTSLRWLGTMPNILFVTIFFCPTLVDVGLMSLLTNRADPYSPLPGTVSDVLRNLEDKKPLLRQLSLPWPYHTQSIPPGLEESLLAILRQSIHLVEVQVTPSVSTLQGLARLPFLRSLTLCSMMEEDEPDARDPDNQGREGDSLFAALEDLFITEASSLPALTRLLHGSHCFPKNRIAIRCREICTESQLATFLQVVIYPLRSKELLKFDLRMGGEWDTSKRWEYGITLDTLRPLLSLHHLENFGIEPGFSLHLNDSDLKEIVSTWPGLTHLDLGTTFPSMEALANFEPLITLQGLQSLTVLPELVQLSLTLAPQSDDLVSLLSPSTTSSSPSTCLMLGPGVMRFSAVEMALFLVQRFPKLSTVQWLAGDEVGYEEYCAQKWEEVGEGLAGARRVLYGTSRIRSDKSVATSE